MKLNELLAGVDILETTAELSLEITGVSYDSRLTKPGDLFVAVAGYETDGHRFIPMAREKGAVCVLCQQKPEGEGPYVLVSDSRAAMARLGRNWFGDPAASMVMVGITGTNGKTTTTYLLKDVLEKCLGAKVGLIGTNQNMIGDEVLHTERTTPESFELQGLFRAMADAGCTHVVMEVSSHALCLKRVAGIRFSVGMFTNLSQDHLDFHGTMEAYCDAKALLFRQSERGVYNADDPWSARLTKDAPCPLLSFGEQAGDLRADNIRLAVDGVSFDASLAGETVSVHERKLDALEDIIEAANGKPVLVAYWFRHDFEMISERLQKLKIPYDRLDVDATIRKWNAGEIPVALIHPASAGHGLNLQAGGSTLVWFGLTWSLELYQQTVARLWRQGQSSETVVVQHIITDGTIDGRIMKALSEKDNMQSALIDAVKAEVGAYG